MKARVLCAYRRSDYKTDTIYKFYDYLGVYAQLHPVDGALRCADQFARGLLDRGLISPEELDGYEQLLMAYFTPTALHDRKSVSQIHEEICTLRREMFGIEVLEKAFDLGKSQSLPFDIAGGIDQRKKKDALLGSGAITFAITQPELFGLMEEDIAKAKARGDSVRVFAFPGGHADLAALPEDACLFFYGEEGLLLCRGLPVDAIVHATPTGYYTRALTNLFGPEENCIIYVPAELDILPWVPLIRRTRLTYRHLARLWEVYGDEIYVRSVPELYARYPDFFMNVYGDAPLSPAETWPTLSPSGDAEEFFREYDLRKEQAVAEFLSQVPGLTYRYACFDENLAPVEFPRDPDTPRAGVLVHAIRTRSVRRSGVLSCGQSSLRQLLTADPTVEENALRLYSNFLFFLTPKLSGLYNRLRQDRPAEQIPQERIHLDYALNTADGRRRECFPLFQKACIGMKEDGTFLFFHFRLGGGEIRVNGQGLSWGPEAVDPAEEFSAPVKVYTPYATAEDREADKESFVKSVGEGRINLVIIQDKLTCIRRGSVLLPSIGVVVSLEEEFGSRFLARLALPLLEDGYYGCDKTVLSIRLDAPADIPAEEWARVQWAYGGGMTLIDQGVGICDRVQNEDLSPMLECLAREGWMSPLSRQTQESPLHRLERHPRTAIGITAGGELVILVFSGRIRCSRGADYREMIQMARSLFPDIRQLMNVDGGGSSVLAMSVGRRLMELSYPATSTASCAGMIRPIHTALCLEYGTE